MKTIKERAEKYGIESANLLCSDGWSEEQRQKQAKVYAMVYSKIATEQKAIDEAEYTEEMRKLNEEWEENLKIQRKMLIDKAIEWLNQNTDWDNIYSAGELQELFRKTMEGRK